MAPCGSRTSPMSSRGIALASVSAQERAALHDAIATLARTASIEMTWRDAAELDACYSMLAPGTEVFVSFLPGQTWRQTVETCMAIRDAGFEPVPHVPVRQLVAVAALEQLAEDLYVHAQVQRVLLIAGDLPETVGPFSSTL